MSFTFYSNIPQPSDNPSISQGQLLQNFTSIGDATGSWTTQDHYGFGTGTDGQHKQVTLPDPRAVDPTPAALESMVYSKDVSGVAELFFKNSAKLDQLTGLPLVTSGTNYGVVTPWGLIINFGRSSANTGTTLVTFAVPMVANALAITTGQTQFNGALKVITFTLTNATFSYSNAGGTDFWYMAIGN